MEINVSRNSNKKTTFDMKNLKKTKWIDPLFSLSANPSVENLMIVEKLPPVKIGLAGAYRN